MNELETIKSLIEDHNNKTTFYWAIIVLMSLNLIASLANFFLAIYLKNKEDKQYRQKVREDRRITIYENLYRMLEELTYYDGKVNNDDLLSKISAIEKYISQNGIYINKEIQSTTYDGLDYYRSITTDFRKKDYGTESNLLNAFVRLFNK